VKRAWAESKLDQVPLLAAGVAFYSFLSLFPAMIAAVTVYGLVASPETVARQTDAVAQALPEAAASIITGQMEAITTQPQQSLGLGLIIALALALWSASGGVGNIVTAINVAYDEEETRGFLKRKLLSLTFTFGAILFVAVAVALIAFLPPVLDAVLPSGALYWLVTIGRYVLLVVAVMVALALLYRYAPDRDEPKLSWVSVGAAVATLIWLVASVGFSLYVDNFGSYSETYGALAGVVIFLLLLWILNLARLFGAEFDAELERGRELQAGIPAEESVQLPPRDTKASDKKAEKAKEDIEKGRALRMSRGRTQDLDETSARAEDGPAKRDRAARRRHDDEKSS
jgi:membrane protein